MYVLLTCKNEEDPIKNRGARVFTTLYINFSDAQGQITQLICASVFAYAKSWYSQDVAHLLVVIWSGIQFYLQ